MSKYRKHKVETKVKEAYSLVNNIVGASKIDNQQLTEWDYSLPKEEFAKKYVEPYIKYSQKFYAGNNASQYYYTQNTANRQTYMWVALASTPCYKLDNGMILAIFNNTTGYGAYPQAVFSVDINGDKKPNCAGRDIFSFYIPNRHPVYKFVDDNTIATCTGIPDGSCSTSINEILNHPDRCNKDSTSYYNGGSCARVIQLNGWKIPDNYPIKF